MTKSPGLNVPTPSDVVGERIRELRRHRHLSVQELADICAKAGHPELTKAAIYTIEGGRRLEGRRRRAVTVDELLAFAEAFDVPIGALLWPVMHVPSDESWQAPPPEVPEGRVDALEFMTQLITRLYGPVRKKET